MKDDALRSLEQLSLYLQSHEANNLNVCSYIDNKINKLQSLKYVKFPVTIVRMMMLMTVIVMAVTIQTLRGRSWLRRLALAEKRKAM